MLRRLSADNPDEYVEHGLALSHRSKCFNCQSLLGPTELIPLLSYLFQFGRSSCCDRPLPINYFVSEVLFSLTFLYLGIREISATEFFSLVVLASALYLLCLADLHRMEVPIFLIIILWIISAIYCLVIKEESYLVYISSIIVAFTLLFLPGFLTSMIIKKPSLGIADPLVFSVLSPYFELWLLPYFMLLSSVIGIFWWILNKDRGKIPFLPSIVLAFTILYVAQQAEIYGIT